MFHGVGWHKKHCIVAFCLWFWLNDWYLYFKKFCKLFQWAFFVFWQKFYATLSWILLYTPLFRESFTSWVVSCVTSVAIMPARVVTIGRGQLVILSWLLFFLFATFQIYIHLCSNLAVNGQWTLISLLIVIFRKDLLLL